MSFGSSPLVVNNEETLAFLGHGLADGLKIVPHSLVNDVIKVLQGEILCAAFPSELRNYESELIDFVVHADNLLVGVDFDSQSK